jgi:hypothetical protein
MPIETDIKAVAKRIWTKTKSAAKLAGEILNPGEHNIDNPDNKKYYEKPEYWEAREEEDRKVGLNTPKDKGIDR